MIDILPQECIYLILDYLFDKSIFSINPSTSISDKTYNIDWKKKLSDLQVYRWSNHSVKGNIFPTFKCIIPLLLTSKEMYHVFSNKYIWTSICSQEFRKGQPYKNPPPNPKQFLFKKAKQVIQSRYKNILSSEIGKAEKFTIRLKIVDDQMTLLDKAISSSFPDDEKITIPKGYINIYGYVASTNKIKLHRNEVEREHDFYINVKQNLLQKQAGSTVQTLKDILDKFH
jgi:hypothetical protein